MKWELDDNARSGFHYLMLGIIVVGGFVLLNVCLDLVFPGLGPKGAFSHGYAINDDGQRSITASTTRAERSVTAVALAFVLASLTGLILRAITRLIGGSDRPAVISAKCVFLLSLAFWGYAALEMPPREFIGNRDGMFILWERDVILNDLPWPAEKHITLIPFNTVSRAGLASGQDRGAISIQLEMLSGPPITIGRSAPMSTLDSSVYRYAEQRAATISAMLSKP